MPSRVADILMAEGRNALQAGQASGALWGNAIAGLGQVPAEIQAQQLAAKQRQAQDQERALRMRGTQQDLQLGAAKLQDIQDAKLDEGLTAQLVQTHSQLDPETGHLVTDHPAVVSGLMAKGRAKAAERYTDFAAKNEEAINTIQNGYLALEQKKHQWRANTLGAIADAPEDQRPGLYATVRGTLTPLAQQDPILGKLPPIYPGHEAFKALYDSQLTDEQRYARLTKAAEDRLKGIKEVPPGGTVVDVNQIDTKTGQAKVLASGAPKEKDEWQTFKESYPKTLGAPTWDALTPVQQQAAYSTYTKSKQDPAMAAVALEMAKERLATAQQKREEGSQPKLEQQYRQVLARAMSSRSGGIGLEDAKVQQANHLMALLDQTYDPNSGMYNIPKVLQGELAAGLARLVAPNGQVGVEMMREFNQRTAKGDLAGALTYVTGTPFPTATQDIAKMLKDSIERQGTVAEQNREGELGYLRALAPTDLEEDRRQALEAAHLNPLRQSRIAVDGQGHRKVFVSVDGGKTWK